MRLLNLSLGLVALVAMLCALVGLQVGLVRLAFPFLGPDTLAEVPYSLLLLTRLAVDLWLPAGLLLLAFRFLGWCGRTPPKSRGRFGISLLWITYMGITALGSWMSWVGLIAGPLLAPVYLLLFAWGAWSATSELRAYWCSPQTKESPSWLRVVLVGFGPPIVAVALLAAAPGDPFSAGLARQSAYEKACREVGVEYLAPAMAPATSIVYDVSTMPEGVAQHGYYKLSPQGRLTGWGGGVETSWSFTEYVTKSSLGIEISRRNAAGPKAPVEAVSADLLLKTEAQVLTLQTKNPGKPGLVFFSSSLVDRRNGRLLATMRYAVDLPNKRGCGANTEDRIDPQAFVQAALRQKH